jgi:hypothetical protein
VLLYLWVSLMAESMGWMGGVLGVFTAPLATAYPLLHWVVRGELPMVILVVWGAGVVGTSISMWWAAYGRRRVAGGFQSHTPVLSRTVESAAGDDLGD